MKIDLKNKHLKNNQMTTDLAKMSEKNKFNKGKIYKLYNIINKKYYIGSTIDTLKNRKANHKRCSKIKNYKLYQEVNKIGWDKWKIILIEEYSCNSKKELEKREGYYQKLAIKEDKDLILNILIAGRSAKEYYLDNREKILDNMKKYAKENEKERKIYRENNKDHIKNYNTEYIKKNKDNLNAKKREKIECKCGATVSRNSMAEHKRSRKHQEYLVKKGEIKEIKEYKKNTYKTEKEKKEYDRLRYLQKKDKILKKNKIRVYCDYCKKEVLKCAIRRHERTKSHIQNKTLIELKNICKLTVDEN